MKKSFFLAAMLSSGGLRDFLVTFRMTPLSILIHLQEVPVGPAEIVSVGRGLASQSIPGFQAVIVGNELLLVSVFYIRKNYMNEEIT